MPTTLTRGQVAIIGVNTEDNGNPLRDLISFVLLTPITTGTVIYFTDRSWNGTTFSASGGADAADGTFTYTAGSNLAAGTVITISQAQLTAAGMALDHDGDAIYVYQGTNANTPTVFLHAVELADGNNTFNGSLVNTGLVAGTSALAIGDDNVEFGGRTHNIGTTDLFVRFNQSSRWVHNENSPQDGTNGLNAVTGAGTPDPAFTAPDFQLWVAGSGAGEAIVTINLDGTYASGTLGYQIVQAFQNDLNLFHPSDITLDTVHGKFFFADSDATGHNRIVEGSISQLLNNPGDPATFTILYSNAGTGSTGIITSLSIDTANGIIYYDIGGGATGSSFNKITYSLTGSSTAGQTPTQLASLGSGHFITQTSIDYVHGIVLVATSRIQAVFGQDVVSQNYVYRATGLTPASASLTFTELPFNPDDNDAGGINNPNIPGLPGEAWPVERGTIRGIDIDEVNQVAYIVTGSVILDTSVAQDGSQLTTFYGGVYRYNLLANPSGDVTLLYQQNGSTGPVGLLYYIEVDPTTGRYYVVDTTGTNADPGDGSVWSGSLTVPGTPTFLATVGNLNGLGPQGLEIQHAPTLTGTSLAATFTETGGNPSPNGTPVTTANTFNSTDADSGAAANGDHLAGAQVRISGNFQSGAGHADQLLVSTFTTGTNQNGTIVIGGDTVTYSYSAASGVMTFTGVTTLDNYENVIARIQFRTDGDNPTAFGTAGTRTISYSTFDGLLYSDEIHAVVTVTGVNDAPVNTPGAAMNFSEDTTGNVGAEGVPPTPVSNAVTGISVFDVDADPATQDITVTLSVGVGTLSIRTNVAGGIQPSDVISGNGTGTIVITATQNEINTTLAAMSPAFTGPPVTAAAPNGLIYTPPANYNGATNLTITTNDNGFNGNDPGLTGTGTTEQDQDVKTINIADVNDAPTVGGDGTESAATILEDTPFTNITAPTVATLFGGQFADAVDIQISGGNPTGSAGDTFAGIAIVVDGSAPASGQWEYWNGSAWTDIGAASQAAARTFTAATQIRFNPALNYNGAAPTLTVHLIETGGPAITNNGTVNLSPVGTATGGTTVYSGATVVLSQAITPVNDAPTSAGLSGDAATYTEGAASALLDVGSNLTVADVDSLNFDTGTLTVHIGTGLVAAQDQLGISAVGGVTSTLTTVSVGGIQIATYTGGGAGGGDLVFTFDADATPAAVQALMRAINYSNSGGDAPTGGSRTINWTLVDGDGTANSGADTLVVNSTVNVVPVNDSPSFTNAALAAVNEDAANPPGETVFNLFDGGYSDPDNAAETINGLAIQGNTANAGTEGSWQYSTDGGANWFNVGAVAVGTALMLDDTALLRFLPVANFNGAPANLQVNAIDASYVAGFTSGATRVTANLAAIDSDSLSSAQLSTSVTALNDAPTSTNLNGDAATWTEGDGTALLDVGSNATLADIDSANFDTGTLTVHIGTGLVAAQDQLVLSAVGGVTFDATTVSVSGTQIATYTGGGAGGGDLVFTFDADATPAAVQALVRAIGYTNTGGISPTGGTRTINWTLVDGDGVLNGGADTLGVTTSVNVVSINDAPAGTDAGYVINEDATYTFSEASFGYSDVNLDDFAGVVVTTIPVPGTLFYDADGAGVGAPVAVTAGQFVSAADIALGRLYYTPLANQSGAPFTSFTFQVRDDGGTAAGGIDTDQSANTITFDVTAQNDAPVNTLPGGQTVNEDSGFTLSTGNGNAISVADVDATTLTVTLSVAHGTLTLASTAGLSFGTGDGSLDTTMTFSGTAAAINAALGAGLSYVATADFNGSDAISVQTTDNGETGAGGTQIDGDSVSISITAINDAPVVSGDGTESATTINEDSPGAGQTIQALFSGQYSDAADNQIPNGGASSPGQFSGIAVTANGSSGATGQWQYFSGGVWTDIGAVSDAAAKLLGDPFVTLIRFNPALNYNGPAPTLTVHLIDNSLPFGIVNGMVVDASVTGGTTAYSTGTVVLSQDVTAVNDAPVNSVPGGQTIDEDSTLTFNAGNGNLISISDADAGGADVTVTLAMMAGQLTLSTTAGLTFSNGDGLDDTTMTFSGTVAAINAALDGLLFEPTINDHDDDVLTITTNDGGASGGAAEQDVDTVAITIDSVNDAPSGADNTVTGSEDDPYVFTAADFGFTDPADGNAFLAISVITFPANGTLFLDSDGPGGAAPIDLSTVGMGAFVGIADINAGHLYFQPDPDEFGDNYATFTFKVQDDGGITNGGVDLDPTARTMTIDIEADNLAPVVDLNAGAGGIDDTNIYVEQGAPSGIGVDIAVSDPDAGDMIEGATVAISDPEAGDVLTVNLPLPPGISVDPSSTATVLVLTGTASAALYAAALGQVGFSSPSDDPTAGGTHTTRSIAVTVDDGDASSAPATMTMTVFAVEDDAVAVNDAVTTDEASPVSGNVFTGAGADSDPDGPPLEVAEVNGSSGDVGTQITLPSGALLTLNEDGSFDYDPNGAFDVTPTPGSGASNTPAEDSFEYTLVGGDIATVTVTITGVDTDDLLIGTAGDDTLVAGGGEDILLGAQGVDILFGGHGDDLMAGGAGTDGMYGGDGDDTYLIDEEHDYIVENSGEGTDIAFSAVSYGLGTGVDVEILSTSDLMGTSAIDLYGNEIDNLIYGNAGANLLDGDGGADVIVGLAGNDLLVGNAGEDVLDGGDDDDVLLGGAETDILIGGAGNDTLAGGAGIDGMHGGDGDDAFFVDDADDYAVENAAEGQDILFSSVSYSLGAGVEIEILSTSAIVGTAAIDLSGNEIGNYVYGNNGINVLSGGGGDDVLVGFAGADTLLGGDGQDNLDGGADADTLIGGGDDDTLLGDGGNDALDGGTGADEMVGGIGNDSYYVDDAGDVVLESDGEGFDIVYASASHALVGGSSVEILSTDSLAGTAAIDLTGNDLANILYGNAGNNILDGKGGADVLVGLGGADRFTFSTALGAGNVDQVDGFAAGSDKIALAQTIFDGLALGALSASVFVVGTAATDEDHRIVYDSATGALYYDQDGVGGADAVQFATLLGAPPIAASDFTVI